MQKRPTREKGWPRRHRTRDGVIALGVAVVLTACSSGSATPGVASLPGHGSSSPPSGPLTQSQSDRDMVDFARCMRAHGVQMSDPFHRSGHAGLSVDIPTPDAATQPALSACNHFVQPIISQKAAGARQQLAAWLPALVHYARCMRNHDISMLDPNGQGALSLGPVAGITDSFGRYSPQFRSADAACRHLLPAAVHDDGTGP